MTFMRKILKNHLGFSLIEILIALGILAGSVGVFVSRAHNSSRMTIEDQRELTGVMLANNKMIEVEAEIGDDTARGKFPDEKEEAGVFEEPFGDYSWNYLVRKVEIPVAEGSEGQSVVAMSVIKNIMKQISKSVRELKVTVSWGEKDEEGEPEFSFSLTTHVVDIK